MVFPAGPGLDTHDRCLHACNGECMMGIIWNQTVSQRCMGNMDMSAFLRQFNLINELLINGLVMLCSGALLYT